MSDLICKACEYCEGACCKYFGLPMKVPNKDIERWLKFHKGVTYDKKKILIDIPCKNLVDGKCKIYRDRPNVCKVYQVGCESCLESIERICPEKLNKIKELMK